MRRFNGFGLLVAGAAGIMVASGCAPAGAGVTPSGQVAAISAGGVVDYDVVVIGASSAGVGAAIGAARQGAQVLLTEPTGRVGGMLTNGVTTDMMRQDASSGLFDEHRRLVRDLYRGHPDAAVSLDGFVAEPDVALAALRTLLDHPNIDLMTRARFGGATADGRRVTSVEVIDGTRSFTARAPVFVDGTAEGDLLGAVGLEGRDWVVGREGAGEYGESLAPAVGDRLQQAYNYRLTVQIGGRTDFAVPATYQEDRLRYAAIDRSAAGQRGCTFTRPGGTTTRYAGMRIQRCLPDGKMDINADIFGENMGYPTAGPSTRAAIERRLRDFAIGYLHWLRTEAGMPELGLPLDDYVDSGGFPSTLYVREGRRLRGLETFTQHNAAHDSAWPGAHRRSVAIGEYGLDSHCTGPRGGVAGGPTCDGGFWWGARPYGISYDIMVPVGFDNLLVPAAVSASHVGYSTLRMEPVRMNLGHAAGIAAATAGRTGTSVADVDVDALQRALVERDQAIVYLPGLPTSGPTFVAAQLAAARSATMPGSFRVPVAPVATPPADPTAQGCTAGDGRTSCARPPHAAVGGATGPGGSSAWVAYGDGAVHQVGGAPDLGDAAGARLNAPVVGMAATADARGYWLLARDGGVFSYGSAAFHGSTGALRLNQPIVSLASDPPGRGYHFVAADGGVFSFGAPFRGSAGSLVLAQPVVGMATTTSGDGYWLVARDGGIFSYGDAPFSGSTGAMRLNQPIVGMAADPDGLGYWFVAADGGVFSFDAAFHGSPVDRGGIAAGDHVVGMTSHPAGGYVVITASGRVMGFGAASAVTGASS